MGRFCIDANVFLTVWYQYYPPSIFPSLWNQLLAHKDNFTIIKPIFDEIEPVSSNEKQLTDKDFSDKYPVRSWLITSNFEEIDIDADDEMLSLELEMEYEISEISKGVGQVDLTLIAYAKNKKRTIITYESIQNQPPKDKSKYKIPLVCKEQRVECITFIDLLKQLSIRI